MENYIIARVLHVVGVVIWIGGVTMVTMVVLPSIKRLKNPEERLQTFEEIEGSFARIAKITTLITGITGFYMIYLVDGWSRYTQFSYWWIHAMTAIWLIFTIILFVLEPFILHKLLKKYSKSHPLKTYKIIQRAHWFLLTLSIITIIGAVAGSHGWQF